MMTRSETIQVLKAFAPALLDSKRRHEPAAVAMAVLLYKKGDKATLQSVRGLWEAIETYIPS